MAKQAAESGTVRRRPAGLRRWFGRAGLVLFWLAAVSVIVFSLLLTGLRLWGLPQIEGQRERIVALASEALGVPVEIDALRASWDGINPRFELFDLRIAGADGGTRLRLPRVEAVVSWLSLAVFDLRLARLQIDGPNLVIERDAQGRLSVAGIPLADSSGEESPAAGWLLHQHRIVLTDGQLTWIDHARGAPALQLNDIAFRLDNIGPWHRFALRGTPPAGIASPLDLRGSLFGFAGGWRDDWRGELFVDLDRVDLAAWQQWLTPPFDIRGGGVGLRAWLDVSGSRIVGATADLRLVGANLRLAADRPRLPVDLLAGRVSVRQQAAGYRVSLNRLQFHTTDGLHVDPIDADIAWQFEADGRSDGHVEIARVDLGTLARVADHLPLDAGTRRVLADYRPVGRLADVRASWLGKASGLEAYSLRGNFDQLGLRAQGRFPGVQGFSGSVEANERWGRLFLRSGPSALELPAVFPQSLMAFDSLAGSVRWTFRDGELEVDLQALNFDGIDAVGTARGRYEYRGEGPGYLDLSAELDRAEATAVWRYLPHIVTAGTRDWLRHALAAGVVDRASLRLEGELKQFPFDGGDGTFLVTAHVRDGRLAYQPGWPAIEALDADLRFAGSRMEITSRAGTISGVPLQRTVVVLPDLASHDPVLRVDGGAAGPVHGFLRFLDQSPVGETIGGFYRDWRTAGDAQLRLGLSIPLANAAATRVEGEVELREARLRLFDFLPPVQRVSGKLAFSESGAEARELRGDFLGAPVRVTVKNADGATEVSAQGSARADAAYRHYGWGFLPSLGGEAAWQARVRVPRGGGLGVDVRSDLVGLASSLDVPLNKAADEPLPLIVRYRRGIGEGPDAADRFEVALGGASSGDGAGDAAVTGKAVALAELEGRLRGERWRIDRGAIAVGETLVLPLRGFVVSATLPFFDADFWRRAFVANGAGLAPAVPPATAGAAGAKAAGASAASGAATPAVAAAGAPAPAVAGEASSAEVRAADWSGPQPLPAADAGWPVESWPALSLRIERLRFAGRDFHEARIEAAPGEASLRGSVQSPAVTGQWAWRPAPGDAPGLLHARLQRLAIPALPKPAADPVDAVVAQARAVLSAPEGAPPLPPARRERLPDLDVIAEDGHFGPMALGRVELRGRNAGGDWLIDRFAASAPDGEIVAVGGHYNHDADETRLSVNVNARDLGSLLDRLGYGGALSRGEAALSGTLRWPGGVTDYVPARLGGDFGGSVGRGRFRSLEHGGARLLGLLSLQNLPRRLLFDFGDVVQEGIAFDQIEGRFAIADGLMRTEGFRIDSPSGRVLMAGDIDLGRETQDLRLAIRPAVGSTVALGAAALVNPIAGVATLLAQKLLRDPLDKAFAVEYTVKGKWAEPQVERIGQVGGQVGAQSPDAGAKP